MSLNTNARRKQGRDNGNKSRSVDLEATAQEFRELIDNREYREASTYFEGLSEEERRYIETHKTYGSYLDTLKFSHI